MARTRHLFRRKAERLFPHKIDVRVPARGFGKQLDVMLAWCREHAAPHCWGCHGRRVRTPDGAQQQFLRFYFADAQIAEAFRLRLADSLPADDGR